MTRYSHDFFAAVRDWISGATLPVLDSSGRPILDNAGRPIASTNLVGLRCDIGPVTDLGLNHLPYCVLDPHWVSEPDIGGKWVDPTAQYIGIQVNSYGKIATDALWLDQAVYDLLIDGPIPSLGVEIIYREADALPTLTWESTGVMLCKHWYRMTFR